MDITGLDRWHFELTREGANALLRLVLEGKKRATASSVFSFEAEGAALPRPGDRSVITDWDGTPGCVIETTRVLPFRDISFDLARLEGENESLSSWREGHIRFFTEEGRTLGYDFTWDLPVVFEEFRVLEVL